MDDAQLDLELLLKKNNSQPNAGDGSVDFRGQPVLKSKTGTWRAFPYIFVNELCERLSFHGVDTNLVNYLTHKLHQGNVAAARNVTTLSGTCFITPLIGAFIADAYWGKCWTIVVFSVIYLIGMSTLTLSASVPAFVPAECVESVCPSATPSQYVILFGGLYLVALGAGGIKPCVSAFGADQFDETDPKERVGRGSFFNWYYFSISLGSLVSSTVMVWIQENVGWGLGFGIPTLIMGISLVTFICGTPLFRFQRPRGSPLTRICQVVVASSWKWKWDVPHDSSLLHEISDEVLATEGRRKLEHTDELKFLDKAAVLPVTGANGSNSEEVSNHWRLCSVTQVEELKILIRMFPIWATSIVFSAIYAQMPTMFVEQGNFMDRKIGSFLIPAASLSAFDIISIMFCIPIYDMVIIRIARKFTGRERGLTNLQRMGVGLFISILTMLTAALVEIKRLQFVAKMDLVDGSNAVSMSVFWQIPQYFLVGVAETFFYVGKMEFFYDESPDAMRSFCYAFSLLTFSLGNYLNSLILTIVSATTTAGERPGWIPDNLNQGQLYNYFFLWAGFGFSNLLVFLFFAMRYKPKTTL